MKKLPLVLMHLLIMGQAIAWTVFLMVKELPRSNDTPEQWRQKAERVSDVAKLRETLVSEHKYILCLESLVDTFSSATLVSSGFLSCYALGAMVRTLRRKQNDNADS